MSQPRTETIVKEFFAGTGLHAGELLFVYDEETKILWCSIIVADGRMLTGKNGETLGAINHILRRVIDQNLGIVEGAKPEWNVIVDINNFQKKRVDSVKAIAHMMAERARFFKSSIEIDPMPPFERRIVHEFLASSSDLTTESIGDGPKRRIVIKYVGGESLM
jgi:spoIIIJ-associated protein